MTAAHNKKWIRSAGYDLSFVMGGALFTLAVAALVVLRPSLLPLLFWAWLICFEGSHFWATYTRTYIDSAFKRENANVLARSVVFFIFPILAVTADKMFQTTQIILSYGFIIFIWSLYHNVRQHYGFVSIYIKKSGMPQILSDHYRSLIYYSVCAAQLFFAVNYKTPSAYHTQWQNHHWIALMLFGLPMVVSLLSSIYLLLLAIKTYRNYGAEALVPALYVGICLVFYSAMFYIIAPKEPLFVAHANGAQFFMLITIMNSLFHNIQYHAIVWHYASRRYQKGTTDKYGLAQLINSKAFTYMITALLLGASFAWIVWKMGDWPSWTGHFAVAPFNAVAYILYFGIVGHHFYLDQYIWKPSKQPELRSYLSLSY
jgi:hypothetical protein